MNPINQSLQFVNDILGDQKIVSEPIFVVDRYVLREPNLHKAI